MTNTVVTDAHNTVIVGNASRDTVVIVDTKPKTIVTGMMGPSGTAKLSSAQDINFSGLQNGSMLIYNSTTEMWDATNTLAIQIIDCGQF